MRFPRLMPQRNSKRAAIWSKMETTVFENPTIEQIERAAKVIRDGGLVVFPTETVFGLGANALDADAAKKIYAAKGRPSDNPLIIHLAKADDAEKYAETNDLYFALANRFMPGPLTVILPAKDIIPRTVTGGLDTVAVRVPIHKTANALIRAAGVPIAAPSANISGKPSPTRTSHVICDMYGRADIILGGEACDVGVESTIITLCAEHPTLLRPGHVTLDELREVCPDIVLSQAVLGKYEGQVLSPGMSYKHYAPKAAVTIVESDERKFYDYIPKGTETGILCFDDDELLRTLPNVKIYGASDDSSAQAKRLFECLREFDLEENITHIYARKPSADGVGLAVLNRLLRAAGFNVVTL